MSVQQRRRSILSKFTATLLFSVASFAAGAQAPSVAAPAPALAPAPIRIAMIEGLSGPFANTGEAVIRNLAWALERVNQRGGVRVGGVMRPMALERYDSKGQTEEALSALRAAIDDGARIVVQGNSSAVAAALIVASNNHN
jgi:branched-chain amino acid transport system substrate-binding protein